MKIHGPASPLIRLGAAFLGLSLLLNLNYPAVQIFSWLLLLPSVDVWLLFIVLAVVGCQGRRRGRHWTLLTLWALFVFLRLFRIGDTAVPMYLDRPFNLYIDAGYLYGLYDLLKTSSRPADFLRLAGMGGLVALLFMGVSWLGWRSAAKALATDWLRRGFLASSALSLGVALIMGWSGGRSAAIPRPPVLARLGQEILFMQGIAAQQRAFTDRLEQTRRIRAATPSSLKGLAGADVLLFMIESYGRTVFSHPQYRQAMGGSQARLAEVLDRHGFEAVSSYLTAPTYGGSSWLSHGTVESGLRVEDDLQHTALLRSGLPPMAAYFKQAGYRTVSVMPGTRFAFPEGAYFGYEQVYYAWHFGYQGPTFGWAAMPDQFVLDWVRRREFAERRQPLFARYVLISSHAAFSIQPPFVEDWDAIGNGRLYHDLDLVYYPITWPDLSQAGEAYLRSLDYEFAIIGDYLANYVDADSLVIIMGDHQPSRQLTGEGEPWSVPVHVISRNPRLLKPFRQRGYTSGLTPAQPLPHAGMESFLAGFLEDFSGSP